MAHISQAIDYLRGKWVRIGAVALCAVTALGLGWLWLRDSSLVRVNKVRVTGVYSSQAPAIRSALIAEAKEMTTLHVREDALKQAVKRFPSVNSLSVKTAIPDRLTIDVVEHEPVAVLTSNGRRVPVTASGLLLHGVPPKDRLPMIALKTPVGGKYLKRTKERAILATLAAAPTSIRGRINHAWFDSRGLTVEMRSGPRVLFGSPARIHSKWNSAIKVMADRSSSGAHYIDVRLPERVAVGGVMTPEEIALEQETARQNKDLQAPDQSVGGGNQPMQPTQESNP